MFTLGPVGGAHRHSHDSQSSSSVSLELLRQRAIANTSRSSGVGARHSHKAAFVCDFASANRRTIKRPSKRWTCNSGIRYLSSDFMGSLHLSKRRIKMRNVNRDKPLTSGRPAGQPSLVVVQKIPARGRACACTCPLRRSNTSAHMMHVFLAAAACIAAAPMATAAAAATASKCLTLFPHGDPERQDENFTPPRFRKTQIS